MPPGDRIQSQLSGYAASLAYERLDEQTVHAAKVRVIDTFGALVGGFAGDPCRIAREVAAQMPNPGGASITRPCGLCERDDGSLRRDE
jgi:2-methylcitrate dehydratase